MKSSHKYSLIACTLLLCLLCNLNSSAQKKFDYKAINWGFCVGVNALAPLSYDVYWNDQLMENEWMISKVGISITSFARINLGPVFFQPEVAWNIHRQRFAFDIPEDLESTIRNVDADVSSYSANIGMLFGYNIIKNGPYLFNIMMGASFKYNYSERFDFNRSELSDFASHHPDYNYLGIIGASFSIAKIYFDFRYEVNFPNTKINFAKLSEAPNELNSISLDKNENILSFSVGLIF